MRHTGIGNDVTINARLELVKVVAGDGACSILESREINSAHAVDVATNATNGSGDILPEHLQQVSEL